MVRTLVRLKGFTLGGVRKMNFHIVCDSYINSHDISKNHERRLRTITNLMAENGITTQNITAQTVSLLLTSLRTKHNYSNQTLTHKRRLVLCLWRHGISTGAVTASGADEVIAFQLKRPPVKAYSRAQVSNSYKILQAKSEDYFGNFRKSKCSRKLWLMTWFRTAYESGLRFGDCYSLQDTDIHNAGIAITMRKTGRPAMRSLQAETIGLIDSMLNLSPDGSIFSWAIGPNMANQFVSKAFKQIGLKHGHSQWLRRSSATHVEQDHPGMASRFLGHSNPMLAERHYLDQSQLMDNMPAPPRLDDNSGS